MSDVNQQDISYIKHLLQQQNIKLDTLTRETQYNSRAVDHLSICVIGNKELGQNGLVDRVNKLDDKMVKVETIKNRTLGGVAVIVFLWSIASEYIKSKFGK